MAAWKAYPASFASAKGMLRNGEVNGTTNAVIASDWHGKLTPRASRVLWVCEGISTRPIKGCAAYPIIWNIDNAIRRIISSTTTKLVMSPESELEQVFLSQKNPGQSRDNQLMSGTDING